jgi:alcohol dehydrogenase class IV
MTGEFALGIAAEASVLGPREVRVGDGAVDSIGALLERWNVTSGRVLLVCDTVLVDLGVTERVETALATAGYRTSLFAEVAGEPDLSTADAAAQRARDADHVAVVGVGGGSAMDLAKVAAALATNPGSASSLVGADTVVTAPLPLVLVPTTAGTGSEATRIAMLSDGQNKAIINDARLVPLAAVLDPSLVTSLPRAVTASTGMDALSHAVESTLSTSASAISISAASQAAELLSTWLPQAFHEGSTPSRRATLYGAYLAGVALNAGVVLGHSIAYTIANRTGLPHGITSAMALPYCIAYDTGAARERIEHLAKCVSGLNELSAAGLCQRIVDLNHELGIPASLEEVGIPSDEVGAMATECRERYPRPNNPAAIEAAPLEILYQHLWRGTAVEALAALT